MKYFVFDCGCKYLIDEVKRNTHGKRKCPDHKTNINHGEIHCICGEVTIVAIKGMKKDYCDRCYKIRRKSLNKKRRQFIRRFPNSIKLNNNIVNMTYEEISMEIGVSVERVRCIELEAIDKIKKQIHRYPALEERLKEITDMVRVANRYYGN